MKNTATRLLAVLFLACLAGTASATQYPPGPNSTCPDTLKIRDIQNPAAVCHPVNPDSVYGIRGIITGFDTFTNAALYIQNSNGEAYGGIDVFTNNQNFAGLGFALGDSVAVYGQVAEFQGGTEITAFDGSFGTDRVVRKISSGNRLPPFKIGTVAFFNQLSTNPNGELWEGCLIKVRTPMRVVRSNLTGGSGYPFRWMMLVDNSIVNPTDSLLVDLATLCNPAVNPLAVGAIVDSIQGIYDQRTKGYLVQPRDASDIFGAAPPSLAQVYPIADNILRVVFDRPVTLASAQNTANYALASFGTVNSATLEGGAGKFVQLNITNGLSDGDPEGLTVNGVASTSGPAMTSPQTQNFFNGVMTVANLQAPDPAALAICEDRSRYAGTGSATGNRMAFSGVCTAILNGGQLYYVEDEAGGARSGVPVYLPSPPLVVGHKYVIAAQVQEFFNETEVANAVYISDQGLGTIPQPVTITVHQAADSTCDNTQSLTTGEDYEGVLVRLNFVRATQNSPVPGGFFYVVSSPFNTSTDSIQVDNYGDYTYQADSLDVISVQGILRWSFGKFRINPRSDADIFFHGNNVGVDPSIPTSLRFAAYPNPARTTTLSFGLPKEAEVELGVYDVSGRQVASVFSGRLAAGTYTRRWDGLDSQGKSAGAGVYFYRLRVGSEVRSLRGVHLQ